jgi:hypothetical protein
MCHVRAAEMLRASWFMNDKKAGLVFIGCGGARIGKDVAIELGIFRAGARMLVDDSPPWYPVYRALGAHQSILGTFTFTRPENYEGLMSWPLQVLKKGKLPFIKGGGGDPFLQGATFIFDANKKLVYRQIETSPGYPKVDYTALKRCIEEGVGSGLISVRSNSKNISALRLILLLAIGTFLAKTIKREFFKLFKSDVPR